MILRGIPSLGPFNVAMDKPTVGLVHRMEQNHLSLSGLAYSTTYKVWVNATDPTGSGLYMRKWYTFTTQQQQNVPPNKPATPSGEASGKVGVSYVYESSTTDIDGDQIYYLFDWGDGTDSGWVGPYDSGDICQESHIWNYKRKLQY